MALVEKRPITPSQRFRIENKQELSKKRPERKLTQSLGKTAGRNCYGRVTSRRRGGGHKRLYRIVDFKREKLDMAAKVEGIEYDPNRSANIALVQYEDGEKRYILAPAGIKAGDEIMSSEQKIPFKPGNNMPLSVIPPSTRIHAIQMQPGRKAQMVRTAGAAAQLVAIDGKRATIKLPSGEIRTVLARCRATIGEVGNSDHQKIVVGKAGRSRWMGKRPRVRGVAMNPVDHPMGGGEGRTSGGGHPVSPWGQLSKGYPTRSKNKQSDKYLIVRRDGRRVKK